jgi:hypothetical protein
MGFDADPSQTHGLDRGTAAEFSHGAVQKLRTGETEREVERKASALANHAAREEKTRVVEEDDVRWACTIVVANGGKVELLKYVLLELPRWSGLEEMVVFTSFDSQVSWSARSIRTMELRPV